MITLLRTIRLWQLRTKWKLAFYQFLEGQLKDPKELEKKLLHELAALAHEGNSAAQN